MYKEDFFTRVAISYQHLISSSCGEAVPDLRDYCRKRHVAYRDFLHWASTHDLSGLLEAERDQKRLKKGSSKRDNREQPLLYPLRIITGTDPHRAISETESCSVAPTVVRQALLQGVRITFPNGVKMSVRQADCRSLRFLVCGNDS